MAFFDLGRARHDAPLALARNMRRSSTPPTWERRVIPPPLEHGQLAIAHRWVRAPRPRRFRARRALNSDTPADEHVRIMKKVWPHCDQNHDNHSVGIAVSTPGYSAAPVVGNQAWHEGRRAPGLCPGRVACGGGPQLRCGLHPLYKLLPEAEVLFSTVSPNGRRVSEQGGRKQGEGKTNKYERSYIQLQRETYTLPLHQPVVLGGQGDGRRST